MCVFMLTRVCICVCVIVLSLTDSSVEDGLEDERVKNRNSKRSLVLGPLWQ